MLHKGIKYIPAIVYTAYELRRNYELPKYYTAFELCISLTRDQSRLLVGAYRKLRKKVKGARTLGKNERLRSERWGEGNVTRVVWPPKVLDLEEVQEEMKRLTEGGDLLSKDDPKDGGFTKKYLMDTEHTTYRAKDEAVEPLDVRINGHIGYVNCKSRAWGEYLKAIHSIHHKYPDTKFYLHVMYF